MKNFGNNYAVGNNYSIYAKATTFECVLSQREKELGVRYIVATFGSLKAQPQPPHIYGRRVEKRIKRQIKA